MLNAKHARQADLSFVAIGPFGETGHARTALSTCSTAEIGDVVGYAAPDVQ